MTHHLGPRLVLIAGCALALSGCALFGTKSAPYAGNEISSRPPAASVDGKADWSWTVSGDQAVRPIQVFSLKGKTYLQMRPGQLVPAIIVGGRPIPYVISPPYLVVTGKPQRMNLMADGYRAIIAHRGPVAMPKSPKVVPDRVHRVADTGAGSDSATIYGLVSESLRPSRVIVHPSIQPASIHDAAFVAKHSTSDEWSIRPSQQLLSHALHGWTHRAGLTLVWHSRVDVPITGRAQYQAPDIYSALQQVLSAASTSQHQFVFAVVGRQIIVTTVRPGSVSK